MRSKLLSLLLVLPVAACAGEPPTSPVDDLALVRLEGADQGGQGWEVTLSGLEEVPANASPGTGTFRMTINPGQGTLCYELSVSGLMAPVTGSHIHKAPRGSNGGVVVPLITPVEGSSSECRTPAAELLRDIRKNPQDYYVNVHSTMHPGGEVRAQLR